MNSIHHHYNPDWVDDDSTIANFVARLEEFTFLRAELVRAPSKGTVQHYLLVGVRGAGKTTLLKRLAVSIRRDADLQDHLIALSFPEELYQVKNLSDFWWAACDALADELDHLKMNEQANRLDKAIDKIKSDSKKLADNAGFELLVQTCAELKRRPVLLVDNLDLVFQRIDKSGRKLEDPHAAAYWELREALSTNTAPIVIGGTVRLSEPFTDYDKAFYDFFIPKRLGKLSLEEVRQVLERKADAQGVPEVKQRLNDRPSRIEALYELTGGNPRALGLIFDLLRSGASSRAVEDFERLMDITTPYYKARFEDMSEQAQVVMHALAVRQPGDGSSLRFGHTAAEIGKHSGLQTGTVSAQLDILEREGLVEKSAAHGRTQYRIAEQMFRLWLQMRSTRRIRQNVIDLTRFLEAMFDFEELQTHMGEASGASPLADARLAFAVAGANYSEPLRKGLEAYGADRLLQHLAEQGGDMDDYLPTEDLSEDMAAIVRMRDQLQQCDGGSLSKEEQEALLGSLDLSPEQKQASVQALCTKTAAPAEVARLRLLLPAEHQRLLRRGLNEADLPLLFCKRTRGLLPLPRLTPQDADAACALSKDPSELRAMVWRLLGAREWVKFSSDSDAQSWLEWGLKYADDADSTAWANVAGAMRRSGKYIQAQSALEEAFKRGDSSRAWYERANLLVAKDGNLTEIESAYHKSIELDPADAWPTNALGSLLAGKLKRYKEAEIVFRKSIELEPNEPKHWNNLGYLLAEKLNRPEEAETAFRKLIKLEPNEPRHWNNLGSLLNEKLNRPEEAETAFRKSIELDSNYGSPWSNLGSLLFQKTNRHDEAEIAYRRGVECDPTRMLQWFNLGNFLVRNPKHYEEAEAAYRKAIELDPADVRPLNNLGKFLAEKLGRYDEAEAIYRKAIELAPSEVLPWRNLAHLLGNQLQRHEEAETAYRKAVDLNPESEKLWFELASLLHNKLHRSDEAELAYRKAIELEPSEATLWFNLGNLLGIELKRYDEAEAAYRKAIELEPSEATLWINLGNLLGTELKRHVESEAAYRKGIELNPSEAILWCNLGNLLGFELKRYDEAEAAYRKAIELEPSDETVWVNLGNLLGSKLKRYEEAEAACRKAIELEPDFPLAWFVLGDSLEACDRLEEASDAYLRGAELDTKLHEHWKERSTNLQTRICTEAVTQALKDGKQSNLHNALSRLLTESPDIAAAMVSTQFIESCLAPLLKNVEHAKAVLDAMRDLGYEKHARPMLLALEAAITNRQDMLSELEPEIQGAAKHMYERLIGNKQKKKRSAVKKLKGVK